MLDQAQTRRAGEGGGRQRGRRDEGEIRLAQGVGHGLIRAAHAQLKFGRQAAAHDRFDAGWNRLEVDHRMVRHV
jgi:hypothetical protein